MKPEEVLDLLDALHGIMHAPHILRGSELRRKRGQIMDAREAVRGLIDVNHSLSQRLVAASANDKEDA